MTTVLDTETLFDRFLALRRLIGIVGIALPFLLVLGALLLFGTGPRSSISCYYHTGMRDVLVGLLFAIACMLFSYKGYTRSDDRISNLACLFALGVALFPTPPEGPATDRQQIIGALHLTCAVLFLLSLAYFSACIFTRTHPDLPPTGRKRIRNHIYRACGAVILGSLIAMLVCWLAGWNVTQAWRPILLLESLAIIAFGISWIVKGGMLLRDLPAAAPNPPAMAATAVR